MKPLHIYKKNGYWHVADKIENVTYHFNCLSSALYAATKGTPAVKYFNVAGLL